MNPNSILFLYEGDTEKEFYDLIFKRHNIIRKININKSNLHGIFSINKKVKNKIQHYLSIIQFKKFNKICVIVAHDREGPRKKASSLDIKLLIKEFENESRIRDIKETIATQDLESWMFHDIDNIYKYLKTPQKHRKPQKFRNIEAFNNSHLSLLFHMNGKHYQKGHKIEGFLSKLNLDNIYNKTPELQELIFYITSLC